jgi:hypothetical protein
MGLLIDPAALGGLAGLIALGSWAVGRMQGGAPGKRQEPAPHKFAAPVIAAVCAPAPWPAASASDVALPRLAVGPACQQRADEDRRALLANPVALAALHAEASAIRRDERIFERAVRSEALLAPSLTDPDGGWRYFGLGGQPACPGPARQACDIGGGCHALALRPADAAPSSERC